MPKETTTLEQRGSRLDADTIVAIATPPGRGGVGMLRLSGPNASSTLSALFAPQPALQARHAYFTRILDPETGDLLDEAVVTFFPAPRSYTGEDVMEIASHGSPVVLDFLLRQALERGSRLARPGEFTERAFLSGRLDLTEAEAVRDLIGASTMHQARVAAEQLGGALSRRVVPTKQALVRLIATLEAGIDFAEDDIDVLADHAILEALAGIAAPLESLAASFHYGRILHSGMSLAIVGPPNAGKSSLFNRLLDRERAIVTATPGTTRDHISERLAIGGVPVELIDTAGLRISEDEAEAIGIAKTHEILAEADMVLVVTDASQPLFSGESALLASLQGRPHLLIRNKVDLLAPDAPHDPSGIATSALHGTGFEELRERITAHIQGGAGVGSGLLTNARQHAAITRALAALAEARQAVSARIPHEMLMLNLRSTLEPLDELTGATMADDVLNLIFSSFCIGK